MKHFAGMGSTFPSNAVVEYSSLCPIRYIYIYIVNHFSRCIQFQTSILIGGQFTDRAFPASLHGATKVSFTRQIVDFIQCTKLTKLIRQ